MRYGTIVGLASLLIVFGCMACLAADTTAWNLKTPAPDAAKIKPFLDGITSLRSDVEKGKVPADAKARLSQISTMASSFVQQSQMLVASLKQNNETAAFDQLIEERIQKSGHTGAIAQIKKAGGAYAALAGAKKDTDDDLADLTSRINAKAPQAAANIIVGGLLQLMETQDAEAVYGGGVSGTCSVIKVIYYFAIGVSPTYCIY